MILETLRSYIHSIPYLIAFFIIRHTVERISGNFLRIHLREDKVILSKQQKEVALITSGRTRLQDMLMTVGAHDSLVELEGQLL